MKQIPIISSVMLCENTKLSAQHQIKFKSKSDQLSYFKSRAKYQLNNVSYIKSNNYFSGTVRLPIAFTSLLSCDYIVYSNPTDSGQLRTYFSRIDNIRYIDALTSEISFSLDFYQTFLFEYTVLSALTEREHIAKADDKVGFNRQPEPQMFSNEKRDVHTVTVYDLLKEQELVIMMYVKPASPASVVGNVTNPILNSIAYPGDIYAFPYTNEGYKQYSLKLIDLMGQEIQSLGMAALTVDRVFLVPNMGNLLGLEFTDNMCKVDKFKTDLVSWQAVSHIFDITYFRTMANNNMKCFQSPFTEVKVVSQSGDSIDGISMDRFKTGNLDVPPLRLAYQVSFNPYPTFCIWLADYNQNSQFQIPNSGNPIKLGYDAMVTMQLPEFQVTEVQGIGKAIFGLASNIVKGQSITGVSTLTSAGKSAYREAKETLKFWKQEGYKTDATADELVKNRYELEPNAPKIYRNTPALNIKTPSITDYQNLLQSGSVTCRGGQAQNGFPDGLALGQFAIYACVQASEQLNRYDTFFTRYGYAVNEYKIPNEDTREFWNYVKTTEIEIGGNIPEIAKTQIESLYNGGFTIWHTTNILDYSQEN